jgi:antitoxin (DNA-binding transcriptional repressor) of toxin-antitoxin stability system
MEKVSVVEFRRNAQRIIRKVGQGKRFLLTYRGKPVLRLEPIEASEDSADDPIYSLGEMAEAWWVAH